MRRKPIVAFACVTAIAIAFAAACGSFDEADTPSGPIGPDGSADGTVSDAPGSSDAGDAGDDASDGGDGASFPRFCERKAGSSVKFCDDFEQGPLGTNWTDHEHQNDGAGLLSLSGTVNHSLDVKMPATSGTEVSDYWYFGPLTVSATTQVSFSVNGNGNLGGDNAEILQLYEYEMPNRYLGIKIAGGLVWLFVASTTPTSYFEKSFGPVPGSATRITISLSGTKLTATRDDNGPMAEIAIDGGITVFTPSLRLGVGLVYTTQSSAGSVKIDDVLVEN